MKKNNNIFIFSISFVLFFFLGIIFTYLYSTIDNINLFFEADSIRVLNDLTIIMTDHYRTIVHPLFVILFQPVILLLRPIFSNPLLISLVLQSLLSAGSILLMKLILDEFKLDKKIKILLLLIFMFSFSQLVFNATIETYSFSQFFLLLLFYKVLKLKNNNLNKIDYILLIVLGVFAVGITLTNYFLYVFSILFIMFFRKNKDKNKKNDILKSILLILSPILISIILSILQYIFFPDSKLYFIDNVISFLNGTSEEYHFITGSSFSSILNQFKTVFGNSFFASKISLIVDEFQHKFVFGNMYIWQIIISILILLLFVFVFIKFIKDRKKNINNYFWLALISFLFNFILHIFYGNNTGFLYTLHYQFTLILIFIYVFRNLKDKYLNVSIILLGLFLILELISNTIAIGFMFIKIKEIMVFEQVSFLGIFIAFITILLIINCFKKIDKKFRIIIIIFVILINILFKVYSYNSDKYVYRVYDNIKYNDSYDLYLKQLDKLYSDYDVKVYFNSSEKIMFFGMGNRKKILYKNGKLYDINNNYSILYDFDISKEMIIPNEYTVSLLTKDEEEVIIFENENGIYIKNGDNIEVIDEGNKIVLPEFENKEYSEILKVFHQEILFNISDSTLIPNILVYSDAWYRDAMMATMVLEKTNNLKLIKDWVDNEDKIYDEQNGNREVDNLGELLYILEVTNSDNNIKEDIYNEVKRITINNSLNGVIDGNFKTYYPTAIMLYALEKSGKDLGLKLPEQDVYTELIWFYDKDKKIDTKTVALNFPYLGWANYHTNGKSPLYNCDRLYPLSYERSASKAIYDNIPNILDKYKRLRLSPTHLWDASEKFLYLYEK